MSDIHLEVAGNFQTARTLRSPGALPVQRKEGYTVFTLPRLRDYELVVLQ